MRIVAKSTLKEFWQKYPDAEKSLKIWYDKIKNGTWENPNVVNTIKEKIWQINQSQGQGQQLTNQNQVLMTNFWL